MIYNVCVYIYMYVYVYVYIYIYIYIYIAHPPPTALLRPERSCPTLSPAILHRRIRNPRPQPQKFSKLAFLIQFSQYCICPNWLSGALVWVGGSDFIG